jgi:uncharacterized protein YecE (DUF72 family)
MKPNRNVFVGCAGWSISSRCSADGTVPHTGTHLQRYSAVLSAVEINSSFYRSHRSQTYARWRDSTPASFRFSVKIPRAITHENRLVGIDELLDRFLGEVSHLEEKLGCLLLQLPPTLRFDADIANEFLGRVTSRTNAELMCEPRHCSWFSPDVNQILEKYRATRVIADPAVEGVGKMPLPKSDTTYFRLHGSPDMYMSSYSETYLTELAREISHQADKGVQVWSVFDNTANGAAFGNALFLRRCIQSLES